MGNLDQKSKFKAWKMVKTAVFELLKLPNLISRKMHNFLSTHLLQNRLDLTQCGNLGIFLAFRFYVKSISLRSESKTLPFLTILKSLNCNSWFILPFSKAWIVKNGNFELHKLWNGRFWGYKISKFNFT